MTATATTALHFQEVRISAFGTGFSSVDGKAGTTDLKVVTPVNAGDRIVTSSDFPGSLTVSSKPGIPNNGYAAEYSVSRADVAIGGDHIALDSRGSASIRDASGLEHPLGVGASVQLGNGETVTRSAHNALDIHHENATGGSADISLRALPFDGPISTVNISVQGHNAAFGGGMIDAARNAPAPPAPPSGPIPYNWVAESIG